MRILHTLLRLGDLERAIDFYSNHGRRSLDKASYSRAYGFPRARSLDRRARGMGHRSLGHLTLPLPDERSEE